MNKIFKEEKRKGVWTERKGEAEVEEWRLEWRTKQWTEKVIESAERRPGPHTTCSLSSARCLEDTQVQTELGFGRQSFKKDPQPD